MTETITKTRLCVDCDTTFEGTPRAKLCDSCREERRKANARAATAAWRARQPKQELPALACEDCGKPVEHTPGGRTTKKYCDDCLTIRARDNTKRHKQRKRAEAKAAREPRTCLDCPADLTQAHGKQLRCEPCRMAMARDYQRKLRAQLGPSVREFDCIRCEALIDRKGRTGRPLYCGACVVDAVREARARADAKRRAKNKASKATHCHYCGNELEKPYHPGRFNARCFTCKREWHYAYMRDRTTARRPTVAPCRDCGDPVPLKRKGPRSIRCGSCTKANRKAQWLKYAQVYRHMRRAWKYATGYERFSPKEIYERDCWRCGVCRKAISRKLRHPNPLSVSLDHKISLSRGGCHSRRNTQAAHLLCNIRKNRYDALPGEQMPLPIVF